MSEDVREMLLPAALICKNFIAGMKDCNYERYLLEIVNASCYFLHKSNNETYSAPVKESHGEYDCCSYAYSMDFKLIASETALRARNLFSRGITKLNNGVTFYHTPKVTSQNPLYRSMEATRIHAALRSLDSEKLKEIRSKPIKKQGIEKDIQALLKTLETQKNLFLFFPYEFYYEQNTACESFISDIINALNRDFVNAIEYRAEVARGYDTYLSFVYENQFIITIVNGDNLLFADTIDTKLSQTYMQLCDCARAKWS